MGSKRAQRRRADLYGCQHGPTRPCGVCVPPQPTLRPAPSPSPRPFTSFHQASWRIGQGNWWGSFKTDSPRENSRRRGLETELKSAIYCKKLEKPQTLRESGGGSGSAGCGTAWAHDRGCLWETRQGSMHRWARCPPSGVFQICPAGGSTGSCSVVVGPSFAWAWGCLGPTGAKWGGRRLCSFVCSQEYPHSAFYPMFGDTLEHACLTRLNEWGLELQRVSTALRVKQRLELTESLGHWREGLAQGRGKDLRAKPRSRHHPTYPSRSQVLAGQQGPKWPVTQRCATTAASSPPAQCRSTHRWPPVTSLHQHSPTCFCSSFRCLSALLSPSSAWLAHAWWAACRWCYRPAFPQLHNCFLST